MRLNFVHKDNVWVTEFSVSADYNLHIEGVAEGDVRIYQSGVEGAKHALVRGATLYPSYGEVYDMDFSALLYPKYIRVECATEPTMAEVTSEGEVIQIEIPVEPEQPSEPEVLTYAFEIPMEKVEVDEEFGAPDTHYEGRLDGNFSNEFETLKNFILTHGEEEEYAWTVYGPNNASNVPLDNPKITINGFNATWLVIGKSSEDVIEIGTDGGDSLYSGSIGELTATSISFSGPQPYKPEIEYHFDIPMEEVGGSFGTYYEGNLEGDFSDIYNKLTKFARENGNEEGTIYVPEEAVANKINVVVNNDKVKYYYFYVEGNELQMTTDGPTNEALGESSICTLTATSVNYTRGI